MSGCQNKRSILKPYNIKILTSKFLSIIKSNCPHGCPCEHYDCNETEQPDFEIDGVIEIRHNQLVGKIDDYFNNYEISFEVIVNNGFNSASDLSITGIFSIFISISYSTILNQNWTDTAIILIKICKLVLRNLILVNRSCTWMDIL